MAGTRTTYLLVDGENIDATLGLHVLGHRPLPEERPRWDRVREFAAEVWNQPVRPLFFLNCSNGSMPGPFIQALVSMQFRPVPLSGGPQQKVVDIGIQRTIDAIVAAGSGDVLLASHDSDFARHLQSVLDEGRRAGVLGLREYVSADLAALQGLPIFDLEDQVGAFTMPLPRIRIIPLDEFEPARFL